MSRGLPANGFKAAEASIPVVVTGEPREIKSELKRLEATHEVIVVDTPGSTTNGAFTATLLADIAIVPLQPSETDVWAIDKTLETIAVAHEATQGSRPETFIVLTCTALRDVQARNFRAQLEAGFPFRVARAEIRRLFAFRAATGKSVTRMKGADAEKAQADLNALFCEVLSGKLPGIEAVDPSADKARRVAND